MSKAISKKHIIAVISVTIVLAAILSVFAVQQLASQGQVADKNNILKPDVFGPFNETPAATDDPLPTPKPSAVPTSTSIPIPVDFTINGSSHVVHTVNVDLNDGMNREEAIVVAQQLFSYAHSHSTYELKSAEVNDAGVWIVSLPWGIIWADGTQESHSHFFVATIDPTTLTIEYATCE